MANLVPVFKPGKTDTTSANSYRGISLTCILSKVLEKIVFNQLNDYLTQCGGLSDNQYGFRRGRSCADLLLTTLDDWYLAQDAKKFTAIACIDLSIAFDNVRHELLLLTLQKVGINGTVLAWFYNYLNNRQQQIVTQESSSTPFLCSKGVPQGSVLGPLLFKVARNEVENTSFAQRSAHRNSRIWRPELIEPAAERKRRARERRPTSKSAYPDPQILPQCNI